MLNTVTDPYFGHFTPDTHSNPTFVGITLTPSPMYKVKSWRADYPQRVVREQVEVINGNVSDNTALIVTVFIQPRSAFWLPFLEGQ